MAALTATAAAVGAGASLYGAMQADKNARRAMNAQEAAQRADLAFRQQQYDRYMGLYGPIEDKLAMEARSTQPLDYEQNYANIKQQYGDALRNIGTSMGMRGIAGSGLDVGALRGAAMGQAGGLSQAYAQGLINRRNLGMSLTGRGQIQQGAQGLMGGYHNIAGLYGQQADLYNRAAQQGWQGFGQGLGNLGYALQNYNRTPAPTTTTNVAYQPEVLQPIQPRDVSGFNYPPMLDASVVYPPALGQ